MKKKFKICMILIISFFSLHSIAQNDPCIQLEFYLNLKLASHSATKNMAEDFVRTMKECKPNASEQYQFYTRLFTKLNSSFLKDKLEIMKSLAQDIAQSLEIPPITTEEVNQISQIPIRQWLQDSPSDYFIYPLHANLPINTNNHQFRAYSETHLQLPVFILQTKLDIHSSFLICKNHPTTQNLLKPLIQHIQQLTNKSLSTSVANQYRQSLVLDPQLLPHSSDQQRSKLSVIPSQMNLSSIQWLTDTFENKQPITYYENYTLNQFLKPLSAFISIKDQMVQKLKESCFQNQNWNHIHLTQEEYFYQLHKDPNISISKKKQVLDLIQEKTRNQFQNAYILQQNIKGEDSDQLNVYVIYENPESIQSN